MKTLSLLLAIFLFVGFLIYLLIDAIYCFILEKFYANPFVWVVDFKINK